MKKKTIFFVVLGIVCLCLCAGYFGVKKYQEYQQQLEEKRQQEKILMQREKIRTAKQKWFEEQEAEKTAWETAKQRGIEEAKEKYPGLEPWEWVELPEDKINMEEYLKLNGALLEEYTKGDIFTQIRKHSQTTKCYGSMLEAYDWPEENNYVYDNPDDMNHIYTLGMDEEFNISRIRIDLNKITNEKTYWLNITQNGHEGWVLVESKYKPEHYLYDNDYYVPKAAFFPYSNCNDSIYVRKVSSSFFTYSPIGVYSAPFGFSFIGGDIEADYGREVSVSITAVATNGREIKYLLGCDSQGIKGWGRISGYYDLGRGGSLLSGPDWFIIFYFGSRL